MGNFQGLTITQAPTGASAPKNLSLDAQAAQAVEGVTPSAQPAAAAPTQPAAAPEQPTAAVPEQVQGNQEQQEQQEQEQEIIKEAGLDVAAIETSWLESGTIPDGELAKLEALGISKDIAEDYIAYRHAQAQTVHNELIAEAGGEEHLGKMQQWAASAWGQEQLAAYNQAVESDNKGQMQLALRALKADYEKANGFKPKLVMPVNSTNGAASDKYHSFEELVRDQSNPLYAQDPAYRARVVEKLKRSNF